MQDRNRQGASAVAADARTHRDKAAHDWQLDEALKRTHNATMISLLDSDSDRHSDQEKTQPTEENRAQVEKPKVTGKRGRPRKPTKSPKGGHRTSEDTLKIGKPRSRTRGVGSPMKKKAPLSKPTISTSNDESDDRSQGASSDSDSDRPTRVSPAVPAITEKRRSRLSGSSSEDESLANAKNTCAPEDDTTRWRRMPIKRNNKVADSPKKQEKKKSPAKAKPRRSRSRVTNVGGSDSDSESEMSVRNRILVAR